MPDPFCYYLRVRYAECDAQQVVFNSRYVDYVDAAMTEFTRVIWGDYNDLLAQGIDNQVVHLSIDWKAPARFDEVVAITVTPARIGDSSYTLRVDFYSHASGRHLATAEVVYVMVTADSFEKMAIPENMRQPLEKGAPGVRVDHAGAGLGT
jgi:acyl-CoA thioester hydrolase